MMMNPYRIKENTGHSAAFYCLPILRRLRRAGLFCCILLALWIGALCLAPSVYAADWDICSDSTTTDTTGNLFDSGGALGNYGNNETCSFVISPSGSPTQITLSFSAFSVESFFDELRIYDGTNQFGTLLGVFSGFSLPGDVIATSGSMYVRFESDWSGTYSGFAASWTSNGGDNTTPAAIADLTAGAVASDSVTLNWTAPGDDGSSGTADSYDVRYSTAPISDANWASATPATGEPSPQVAGSAETFVVAGLDSSTTYYFAIKTTDEAANQSGLSNIASATTSASESGSEWNICSDSSSTDASGTLYDSGGAGGNYSNNENCSFLISPSGSPAQITLSFSEFNVEFGYDYLRIYDGTSQFGTLLGTFSGNSLPSDVSATSGSMYVVFTSDWSRTYSGFAASWTSIGNDSTPPAAITDLAASAVTSSSITLNWTAPGDDGSSGTAAGYDVRYSTAPINDGNWASATPATDEPSPQIAGSAESFVVTGLNPGVTYYFAIKTSDEIPNESSLSNVASATTDNATFCGSGNLVMVTADGTFNNGYDDPKRTLFASWGFTVTAIADGAAQSTFDSAASANDVMFISSTINPAVLGTKARDLDIGIVLEDDYLADEMAFMIWAIPVTTFDYRINIIDNSHYITSEFNTGYLTVYNTPNLIWGNNTTWAPGGQWLARTPVYSASLYAFEAGDALAGGHTAANRRVSTHFFHETDPAIWNDNLKTLLLRSLEWATCASGAAQPGISGRVFEDVQYGGGSGRSFVDASGVGRSGVTVELYNNSGGFLSSTTTDTDGQYIFSGLSAATYTVRVVNSTVTSSRSGANGSEVAVQTFRADSDGEPAGTGTDKVGGEQPQIIDAAANSGAQTLADLQSIPGGQYTQSIVTVNTSSGSIGEVNFGFNFDTIVNTNDSGQGSLRQFIANANLLANSGLDQDDWGVAKNAGVEHSIFMIPNTDSGYGADPSGGGGNAFVIQMGSASLSNLTDTDTAIDGRTQTAYTGNTNSAVANTSTGPEVVVDFGGADNDLYFTVRGYLYDVGIYRAGAGQSLWFNNVTMTGSVVQGVTLYQGVYHGLKINGSNGITIADSVFRENGTGWPSADGLMMSDSSANTITGNAFVANASAGIEVWSGTCEGNNISQNYFASQWSGIFLNTGSENILSQNTITNHSGDGIIINTGATGNTITQNVIYANGELGIELSADGSYAGEGVTANDANDSDSGANDLLNYPVIVSAVEIDGTINTDFDLDVPAGNYRIEFFINPSGADPSGYGEGESFAGVVSITHPGGGTQSFSHSFSGTTGDIITATATVDAGGGRYGSTSEFSSAYTASDPPPNISLVKSVSLESDPFNNTTNPKMIPGAVLTYTVIVTNQGLGATDADTVVIINPVGSENALFVGDLAGAGSGPATFTDGATASGLAYTFSSLSSTADNISFSNDNGATYTYPPTADGNGCDNNITHLRISPAGAFAASDGTNHPSFTIEFRVRVR